jgi:hypothetical protein
VSCPRHGHKSHSYDLRHELGPCISGELRVRSAEPGTMAHQLVCKIVPPGVAAGQPPFWRTAAGEK